MSDTSESLGVQNKAGSEPAETLHDEALSELNPRLRVVGDKAELLGTKATATASTLLGATNPDEVIKVTVMVKSKASEQEVSQTLAKIVAGKEKPLSNELFDEQFGADPASMSKVLDFAKTNGLKIEKADYSSGAVQLEGKVSKINSAFNVQLEDFKKDNDVYHASTHNVFVPRALGGDIEGVFGLNSHRLAQAQSEMHFPDATNPATAGDISYMPNEVADMYHFPKENMGAGQSVGIIELGGGLDLNDNAKYYKAHNLKQPEIQFVGVDGARNQPGDINYDSEVVLDSQIIGAVAPDARQQLVFAPNTDQGFLDAITRATFAEKDEPQNTAISISWGAIEIAYDNQTVHNMNLAFQKAALKGISVFAASGDGGAVTDGDGGSVPLYPSSDPFVTGTGGTHLDKSGKEVSWNDGPRKGTLAIYGSTGGISWDFPIPEFQKNTKLPSDFNATGRIGRGVPDVAGDASQKTGYQIHVHAKDAVAGGTSCVAPLYAALMMRVNGALGHPVGYLNPFLYQNENSMFKDITEGDNFGYNAGPGWDAVTGLGVINGQAFLDQLRKQNK